MKHPSPHSMRHTSAAAGSALGLALVLAACSGGSTAALDQARQRIEAKDSNGATILLKGYLQDKPDSAEARFLFGTVLLEAGDGAGAEIELRRALELGYPAAKATPPLARAVLAQRQPAMVVAQFKNLDLGERAANLDLHTTVALAQAATGAGEQAEQGLRQVLGEDPKFEPARLALARVQAGTGAVDAALATLTALLADTPGSVEGWRMKGNLLARRRHEAGAIEAFGKGLALDPKAADLHAALIAVHHVRQDGAAAARQFEAMKKAVPNHALTRYEEAKHAFQLGDAARAAELMQPVLRAQPDHPGVLYLAGGIDMQRGALAQAEAHLSRALGLQPGMLPARQLLARLYLRIGQPAKAVNLLRGAADAPDAGVEILTLAGQAALLAADPKQADRYFLRATKSDASSAKARTALALTRLAKGQTEPALEELQAIAAGDSSTAADMALISVRLSRGEFEAALAAIDRLDRKTPGSPAVPELRARAQLGRKDPAAARQSFEQALALQPDYMPALAGLAALDFLEGKRDEAAKRFADAIKRDPRNMQAYLSLADLEARTGATKDAVAKRIGQAITANPNAADPRLALIDFHQRSGDSQAALEAAQAAAAALPDDALIMEQLGRAQLAAGEINQAAGTFAKLASQQSQLVAGPVGLAEVALATQDFDGAARHARRALEIDPRSTAAKRAAITAYVPLKRFDEAVAVARTMQADWPEEAIGYVLEGEIEWARQRWDAAARAFLTATRQPNPAQSPGRLHASLVKTGKAVDAARFAEGWIVQHPDDALFVLYLADAALRDGDKATAERRYRQVLVKQPENALALNNLASILLHDKRPEALELAQRAVKAAPNRVALQDTLALAMAQANQLPQAIEMQRKVVAAAPGVPVYRLTLARIYLLAGDKRAAHTELEALARTDKPFPGREELPALLQRART